MEKSIELTGKVTLNEETYKELKNTIREEVIKDIKSYGHYSTEIEEFLADCPFNTYVFMIERTIDKVIQKNKSRRY